MLKSFFNIRFPWPFTFGCKQEIFGDFLQTWIGRIVVTCALFIATIVKVDAGFFIDRISERKQMKVIHSKKSTGQFLNKFNLPIEQTILINMRHDHITESNMFLEIRVMWNSASNANNENVVNFLECAQQTCRCVSCCCHCFTRTANRW